MNAGHLSKAKLCIRAAFPLIVLGLLIWQWPRVGPVLKPFIIALVLAYILDPLVVKLQTGRFRFSRLKAVIVIYAALGLALLTASVTVLPNLVGEIVDLAMKTPQYAKTIGDFLHGRFSQVWAALPADVQDRVRGFFTQENLIQIWQEQILPYLKQTGYGESAQAVAQGLKGASSAIAAGVFLIFGIVFGSVTGLFGVIFTIVSVAVILFYFLKDFSAVKQKISMFVPDGHRDKFFEIAKELDLMVSGFLRGQLLVCLSVGILTGIGMMILGVDKPLLIALCAGTFNIVPYLGPAMGAFPAVCLIFLERFPSGGWGAVLPREAAVVLWFVFVQTLDGMFISPKIMSQSVKLHPLTILFALLIAGQFFGMIGMMLAVPAAAVFKILSREIYRSIYEPVTADVQPQPNPKGKKQP